jgi:hypothetical protein
MSTAPFGPFLSRLDNDQIVGPLIYLQSQVGPAVMKGPFRMLSSINLVSLNIFDSRIINGEFDATVAGSEIDLNYV